jgi:hypothetical protein
MKAAGAFGAPVTPDLILGPSLMERRLRNNKAGVIEYWSGGLPRLSAIHSALVAALRVLAGGHMQYFYS